MCAIYRTFPEAKWPRCIVRWYRNAFAMCQWKHVRDVAGRIGRPRNRRPYRSRRSCASRSRTTGRVCGKQRGRNAVIHVLSVRTPEPVANQQRPGADHERNPKTNASHRSFSGRLFRPDAGGSPSPAYFLHSMGTPAVHEHWKTLRRGCMLNQRRCLRNSALLLRSFLSGRNCSGSVPCNV